MTPRRVLVVVPPLVDELDVESVVDAPSVVDVIDAPLVDVAVADEVELSVEPLSSPEQATRAGARIRAARSDPG